MVKDKFKIQRNVQNGKTRINIYILSEGKWERTGNPYWGVYLKDKDGYYAKPWEQISTLVKGQYRGDVQDWKMLDIEDIPIEEFVEEVQRRLTFVKKFSIRCDQNDKKKYNEKIFEV